MTAPSVIVPALVVALAFRLTSEPRVIAARLMALLVALIVPFKVTVLGAVAVKPPV